MSVTHTLFTCSRAACLVGAFGAAVGAFAPGATAQEPGVWRRVVINQQSAFEAAGVADFNNDGTLDIMCGDTWYEGPDWTAHAVCEIEKRDGYYLDFANVPMDIDGDAMLDIISCNWHERSVTWRRNPGDARNAWREETVDEPGNCETALEVDVDGDGLVDFLPDVAQRTVWYRLEDDALVPRVISETIGGHGIGVGDVNGDGRADIIRPTGWFEAPKDRLDGSWTFHADWNLGAAGIAILVHDFTGDGLADIVWGMGHDYGMFWLQQVAPETKVDEGDAAASEPYAAMALQVEEPAGSKRHWIRHTIDTDWSQAHALRLVDFDGDGLPEVFTGKRKYAHNGHDPGGEDPMVMWIYSYDRATNAFIRTSVSGNATDGVGLAPVIIDIDDDGDLDIITPGKDGLQMYVREEASDEPAD